MRYSQDDVHAVLMAAASIYSAQSIKGQTAAVEKATELFERVRKHINHQNRQADVDAQYVKAHRHRLNPEDIKSLDGSLLPSPVKNEYIQLESLNNLRASIGAAIARQNEQKQKQDFTG